MTINGRNGSTPTPMIRIVDAKGPTLSQTILTNDTMLAHSVSVNETNGNVVAPIEQLGITAFPPIIPGGDCSCDCNK
jgi:hypothetical protein